MTKMTNMNDYNNQFIPSTPGFDRVFSALDLASDVLSHTNTAFPPVNIVRVDENNFLVELAVAGYKEEEIDITAEKNILTISGKKAEKDERTYLVKGIAGRSFSRQFVLADTVRVDAASLVDGILTIDLQNIIPEAQKPRKIPLAK